ncbi:polyketide synthase [Streptomyces caeni]|uniref:Polyketide synthase n=1 Tax=Streptomyces caeni TaxID=2307231 RepID=A0ABW4IX09_9ACTN
MHAASRTGPSNPAPEPGEEPPSGPPGGPRPPADPIAIVGIGALYPGISGPEALWRLLTQTELSCACPPAGPDTTAPPAAAAGNRCGQPVPVPGSAGSSAVLDDVRVDVARFGIPPAQAASLARMQVLMLEAAGQCLADAGYADRPLPGEHADVVVGTCYGLDRQHANAARVEGGRYAHRLQRAVSVSHGGSGPADLAARELRGRVRERFGASAHDRVGEMASTIPARIASAFKLRGRTLAVESADATSFTALAHALACLRSGESRSALVVTGQRPEGDLLTRALAAKGLIAAGTHPFEADGDGFTLAAGVGALLLKTLPEAEADGDRIYAVIRDCSLAHSAAGGALRYPFDAEGRRDLAARSYRSASVPAGAVQYVECAGSGIARETEAEIEALAGVCDGVRGPLAIGSVKDRLGHTFANSGLAAVSKVALALHHRTLPPQWSREKARALDLTGTPFRILRTAQPWPAAPDGAPRRAAVLGSSVTGVLGHVVVEEYPGPAGGVPVRREPPGEPAAGSRPQAPRRAPRVGPAEPIAVIGYGGMFADSPGADAFWRTMLSGHDRIAPLPAALFDREAYYCPGELSVMHSYTEVGAPVRVPSAPPPGTRVMPERFAQMDAAQRVGLAVAAETLTRSGVRAALTGPGLVAIGSNLGLTREREAAALLSLDAIEADAAGLEALSGLPAEELRELLACLRRTYRDPEDVLAPGFFDGSLASGTAAVIADEFGLDAVPVAVEAACASSLAAIDLAVQQLRSGTVGYAIAGGVELPCTERDMVLCSALGLLSRNRITPFDAAADGFTAGDGCALFLLKRYDDALRDGDRIACVLRGVGASNDAKSLIAPDTEGQARAIRQAFGQVDFGPAEVGYLEAHGTGTRVGDRVEIAAAARTYSGSGRQRPLEIGSAKSFFGHTFAAAGAAGLLRALYALRTGTIPPNANLRDPNPALDLAAVPAHVATEAAPWPEEAGRPRRAGVSSFGTGGINYHLLLEEHREGARAADVSLEAKEAR